MMISQDIDPVTMMVEYIDPLSFIEAILLHPSGPFARGVML